MDISNQNGDAAEESPPPAHQPNGHRSSEPSPENHHPKSPSNEQLHTGIDSQLAIQPKDENNNSQGNGIPETQPPSSGQGNGAEKEPIDPKESLEPFGWDDLEERFLQKMEECRREEAEIEKEFREWCEVSLVTTLLFGMFDPAIQSCVACLFPWRVRYGVCSSQRGTSQLYGYEPHTVSFMATHMDSQRAYLTIVLPSRSFKHGHPHPATTTKRGYTSGMYLSAPPLRASNWTD